MPNLLWRKIKSHSSSSSASQEFANGVMREAIFRSIACAAMLSLSSVTWADAAQSARSVSFNIPQQRADISLTEFAEQANITLIFPFYAAREVMANELVGDYTARQALQILLANTSLLVRVDAEGQLSIGGGEQTGDIA